MTFQIDKLDHIHVFVPSREEAAEWYEKVLGLTPWAEKAHWAKGAGGPLVLHGGIALFARSGPAVQMAFRTSGPGLRAFIEHAAALGLDDATGGPIGPDSIVDHDGAWSVYLQDPWGNQVEVIAYEPPEVLQESLRSDV